MAFSSVNVPSGFDGPIHIVAPTDTAVGWNAQVNDADPCTFSMCRKFCPNGRSHLPRPRTTPKRMDQSRRCRLPLRGRPVNPVRPGRTYMPRPMSDPGPKTHLGRGKSRVPPTVLNVVRYAAGR